MFQGSLKDISKKSKGCFKGISGDVSRVFQGNFKEVLTKLTSKKF